MIAGFFLATTDHSMQRVFGAAALLLLVAMLAPATLREATRIYMAPLESEPIYQASVPFDGADVQATDEVLRNVGLRVTAAAGGKVCILDVALRGAP